MKHIVLYQKQIFNGVEAIKPESVNIFLNSAGTVAGYNAVMAVVKKFIEQGRSRGMAFQYRVFKTDSDLTAWQTSTNFPLTDILTVNASFVITGTIFTVGSPLTAKMTTDLPLQTAWEAITNVTATLS